MTGKSPESAVSRNMSMGRWPSLSGTSVRSGKRGCCCLPPSPSPTSYRTPKRPSRENDPEPKLSALRGQQLMPLRSASTAWQNGWRLLRRAWRHPSFADTGGAGRCVRPHVTPGPIPTSWGPSLPKSWLRYMVAHLLRRATEELHADGRAGSTPQLLGSPRTEPVRFVNILFCGDVVGCPGREAIKRHVPALRRQL